MQNPIAAISDAQHMFKSFKKNLNLGLQNGFNESYSNTTEITASAERETDIRINR